MKFIVAAEGLALRTQHPYGLDVWAYGPGRRGKVLNMEWSDGGELTLRSFRRGEWEAEVLSFVAPAD